ncbi:hypothetical protein [Methylocella silvestris]|uniref:Uncharacterized protein n=1 Tax=Methylocella silvestris TaxID=199596 RepID=A0A2J7TDT2_METSI|nr:hypothetical protein [Methylocella silvestris]PNG24934.1 hypothetical protein CR492_16430 [Methylocella silvestris]
MYNIQFEPFGERVVVKQELDNLANSDRPLQRTMLKVGVGMFWALVIAIVTARAVYFNPNFAESFVAFLSDHLRLILNG